MARAVMSLDVVASHPNGGESIAKGVHKQQFSVSDMTNSASTEDDEFGVGGAWQQKQCCGEGQAGPCGTWHMVNVREFPPSERHELGHASSQFDSALALQQSPGR